jgi:surfactin synthase thioesterase subunit
MTRWVPEEPPQAAHALLLCLPHAGFGARMYRRWPRLADGVGICPVQLPGREDRLDEALPSSYEELADELAEAVLPHLDRPFAFFGHGAGALIGYEATVRLRRHRTAPSRLYVSTQAAPHHGPHVPALRDREPEVVIEAERVMQLAYPGRHGGASWEVLFADVELLRRYRPIAAVDIGCPVTAVRWRSEERRDHPSMRGWADCGPTTFVVLDPGQGSIVDPPLALISALVEGLAPGAPAFGRRRSTRPYDDRPRHVSQPRPESDGGVR